MFGYFPSLEPYRVAQPPQTKPTQRAAVLGRILVARDYLSLTWRLDFDSFDHDLGSFLCFVDCNRGSSEDRVAASLPLTFFQTKHTGHGQRAYGRIRTDVDGSITQQFDEHGCGQRRSPRGHHARQCLASRGVRRRVRVRWRRSRLRQALLASDGDEQNIRGRQQLPFASISHNSNHLRW